jgi:hypothetical protein
MPLSTSIHRLFVYLTIRHSYLNRERTHCFHYSNKTLLINIRPTFSTLKEAVTPYSLDIIPFASEKVYNLSIVFFDNKVLSSFLEFSITLSGVWFCSHPHAFTFLFLLFFLATASACQNIISYFKEFSFLYAPTILTLSSTVCFILNK